MSDSITTVCLTGHRPNKLWGYDLNEQHYACVADALKAYLSDHKVKNLISGMALGFDQLGAKTALEAHVRLIAAVPFAGQESMWPDASQQCFRHLLDHASEVHILDKGTYAAWKMQKRNEWMVDHADVVLALWNGTRGGTANCVHYAAKVGKPIHVLDPRSVQLGKTCRFE